MINTLNFTRSYQLMVDNDLRIQGVVKLTQKNIICTYCRIFQEKITSNKAKLIFPKKKQLKIDQKFT